MHPATSDVAHLPELIRAIFEQGLDPYTIDQPQVAGKRRQWLSAICRVSMLWKDVAYSTPELWNRIEMKCLWEDWDGAELPSYQHCLLQLQRANKVPLHISLNMKAVPSREIVEFWRVWEAVKERAGQWRSIRFGKKTFIDAHGLGMLLPLALPSVVEADFGCVYAEDVQPISAPRLHRLRLGSGPYYFSYFPFISSQALEMFHFTGPLPNTSRLLRESPKLHTLYVDNCFGPSFGTNEITELPSLHCIEARGDITNLSAGIHALRPIAPKWEMLRIICDSTNPNLQEGVAVLPHIVRTSHP